MATLTRAAMAASIRHKAISGQILHPRQRRHRTALFETIPSTSCRSSGGPRLAGMVWTVATRPPPRSRAVERRLRVPLLGYRTCGLRHCAPGCRTRTPGPALISAVLSACARTPPFAAASRCAAPIVARPGARCDLICVPDSPLSSLPSAGHRRLFACSSIVFMASSPLPSAWSWDRWPISRACCT